MFSRVSVCLKGGVVVGISGSMSFLGDGISVPGPFWGRGWWGGWVCPGDGYVLSGEGGAPGHGISQDTVGKRMVRIPLECFLVSFYKKNSTLWRGKSRRFYKSYWRYKLSLTPHDVWDHNTNDFNKLLRLFRLRFFLFSVVSFQMPVSLPVFLFICKKITNYMCMTVLDFTYTFWRYPF